MMIYKSKVIINEEGKVEHREENITEEFLNQW